MQAQITSLYEDKIDKKRTIKLMKSYLTFLSKHVHSSAFDDYQNLQRDSFDIYLQYLREQESVIHEDILDYLNYTKSIVNIPRNKNLGVHETNKVLVAIERKDQALEYAKKKNMEREQQVRWILAGIARLGEKEKQFIIEKFIFKLKNHTIIERHQIVESTLNRNLAKAYLNLAIILKLEVLLSE